MAGVENKSIASILWKLSCPLSSLTSIGLRQYSHSMVAQMRTILWRDYRSKFGAREDKCTIGEHKTIRSENPMKLHLRAMILVMYDFQSTHVQTCHISVRTKYFHSMLTSITCSARYPNSGEKQWGRGPRV